MSRKSADGSQTRPYMVWYFLFDDMTDLCVCVSVCVCVCVFFFLFFILYDDVVISLYFQIKLKCFSVI